MLRLLSLQTHHVILASVVSLATLACNSVESKPPASKPKQAEAPVTTKKPKAEAPKEEKPKSKSPSDKVQSGQKNYSRYCFGCHGNDGTGSAVQKLMPEIKDLTSAEFQNATTDEEMYNIIANGRRKMPGFVKVKVLSEEQIRDIVAYIRTLKK